MADPVQPAPPVNATITIQPVTVTAPNRETTPADHPLANVPTGTLVEGFVINRDAQNNPILRTPMGDLKVTSDVFLKTGSEVVFRVDTSQTSLARILTVDGLSPQEYSEQNSHGITRDTISATALQSPLANAAAQTGKAATPTLLQAIILQNQPTASVLPNTLTLAQNGPMNVLSQLALLSAGTPIKLMLLDLKLPPLPVALNTVPGSNALNTLLPNPPTAGNLPQAQPPQIGTQISTPQAPATQPQPGNAPAVNAAALPQAPNTQATPANATAQPLPQSAQTAPVAPNAPLANAPLLQVQTQLVTASTTPQNLPQTAPAPLAAAPATATITQPNAPNQLVASVIGHDADGGNILHTGGPSLKLYTPQPLPTGTTLLVEATVETPPNASAPIITPLTQTGQTPATTTTPLTTLDAAVNWLLTNHPDLGHELQQRLPSLSPHLASNLLSYIGAIKSGDVNELIGRRNAKLLELGAPELFARLRQQVGDMQAALTDSPSLHWQMLTLPIWVGQELEQARLYISKEPPEKESAVVKPERGQRFVLEVGLSELGSIQFDGFVKQKQTAKNFDLMVRTDDTLPAEISQGIRDIFSNASQITGMSGQIIFQQGRQHFIHPEAEIGRPGPSGGAHTILA